MQTQNLTALSVAVALAIGLAIAAPTLTESRAGASGAAEGQIEDPVPETTRAALGNLAAPAGAQLKRGSSLVGQDYQPVKPWHYGLDPAPSGLEYAVYEDHLLLLNPRTEEVLAVLREVDPPEDGANPK